MHYVSKIDHHAARTPEIYQGRSSGFRRATYVDRSIGSVHMGVGVSSLEPGGLIQPHLHAFEESFFVLEGTVILMVGERACSLGPGDYGLISTGIPHAWRNASEQSERPARWLEMQAPQPRSRETGRDTFFTGGDVPTQPSPGCPGPGAAPPDGPNPFLGRFDESQLTHPGGPMQMEGFNPTTGVAIKMFVDRSFGAVHQSLFLIQYNPGAKIDPHDHAFEESYLIVSGRVQATADGQIYDLGPGDVIWTGVGCIHSFSNPGPEPVRWIETQAPLPPAKEVFRFERDWAQYAIEEPDPAARQSMSS